MSRTSLQYAGCIYSPDSWDKVVDLGIKHMVVVTLIYSERYRQYHDRWYSISFLRFFWNMPL